MAIYYLGNQLPDGIVVAHTLYGEPDTSINNDYALNSTMGPVQQVPYNGMPCYEDEPPPRPRAEPDPSTRCQTEGCNGWRKYGSEHCRWHQPQDVA